MAGRRLVLFSLEHPKVVTAAMLGSTLVLAALAVVPTFVPGTPLHGITVDTDPENMLASDEPVRVFHQANKKAFALYDMLVLGVVQPTGADGVYTPATLSKVHRLTEKAKSLEGVIAQEVMSLSTVDNLENQGAGVLRFEWMMPKPPSSPEEAAEIRRKVERLPFLKDTIAASDGRALAIFVPLVEKNKAHDIAQALQEEIDVLPPGTEAFHIAGLPVAEDTFGVQMFIQMAISAPIAMLVIFLLMWGFFRRFIIVISPMILAMVCSISTMGLLVVSGNTIHIMSSMIPIFIMPIAVLDAIHFISEFYDVHEPTTDPKTTIVTVMDALFKPMLFTSLTTAAGFASLALTPIPPVQVFGVCVAAGVLIAFFWTVTFIPAFIMFINPASLASFGMKQAAAPKTQGGFLKAVGRFTVRRAKLIVVGFVVLGVVSAYGISLIKINDNPTNWFEPTHPIRIADKVLNEHFAGTYEAYLTLERAPEVYSAKAYAAELRSEIGARRAALSAAMAKLAGLVEATAGQPDLLAALDEVERQHRAQPPQGGHARAAWSVANDLLAQLFADAEDGSSAMQSTLHTGSKQAIASLDELTTKLVEIEASAPASAALFQQALQGAKGPALGLTEEFFQRGQVFKDPAMLRYIEDLQSSLVQLKVVGKSNSLADIVKTVHRDLLSGRPEDYRIPGSRGAVAQTLDQFQSSHRKDDLWHFVTPDYSKSVVWIQLKSGDNRDMEQTVAAVERYVAEHPPPHSLAEPKWSGLTYINVVWQDKMVGGMKNALFGSFAVVLLMMVFLFRSLLWGLLSMVPLTASVGLIYGLIGLIGKDYDMPVAVLSSLALGLAIDYAIHFLARSRALREQHQSWPETNEATFGEPARAIGRNAVVVGVGFLPLLLAPLVPYQTVGVLIASILLCAGAATLLILPALMTLLEPWMFPKHKGESS